MRQYCGCDAVSACQDYRATQRHRLGSSRFLQYSATVDSESSGESNKASVSDLSDSENECEYETEKSHAYYLLHDFSAPAIDLLISQKGATVEELAIPSAEEFVNAQLQDADLIALRKWIKEQKFLT